MRTIWKYTLRVTDEQVIEAPEGAVALSVAMQGEALVLWMEVSPNRQPTRYRVYVRGTGHPLGAASRADVRYVGTTQEGALVWHVYVEADR